MTEETLCVLCTKPITKADDLKVVRGMPPVHRECYDRELARFKERRDA